MGLFVFRLSVYNKEEEVDFVLEKMPAIIESLRKNVTFLEGVTE
jgi:cysteine desulfurase